MVSLGDLAGGNFLSNALDVSFDGSAIVGLRQTRSGSEAFRWTSSTGMVGLGGLGSKTDRGFISSASGISGDGSTVVGLGISDSGIEAFIWDDTNNMRSLQSVLTTDYGLGGPLTGWHLYEARGISADGLTIAGYGTNSSGGFEAWIAQLGVPNQSLPHQPVPEPSTMILFGTGLAGIIAWRRKNAA